MHMSSLWHSVERLGSGVAGLMRDIEMLTVTTVGSGNRKDQLYAATVLCHSMYSTVSAVCSGIRLSCATGSNMGVNQNVSTPELMQLYNLLSSMR